MTAESKRLSQLINVYQNALNKGLDSGSKKFELLTLPLLNELTDVGLAHNVQEKILLVLVLGREAPEDVSVFMLDVAKELTVLYKTLIVPDQPSSRKTTWDGKQRGPVIVYRFKLLDSPLSLTPR